MRLIDADALKGIIKTDCSWELFDDWGNYKPEGKAIMNAIDSCPPAEPEIIRCKDCKYYYNNDPENIPTANIICFQMHEEDFCSYAERRTNE